MELQATLLNRDLDGFHRHLPRALTACRQAVPAELARVQANGSGWHPASGHPNPGIGHANCSGHNGRSQEPPRRSGSRRATASQVRAIHDIADRNHVELPRLLYERFGIQRADDLSITEATQLPDELKNTAHNSAGGPR